MRRKEGTWLQRLRVPLGFICGALFILFAQPRLVSLTIGGIVALCGLCLRAWAAGHIRKNVRLAASGPYAYTRNPLYLGSFLLGLGFTLACGRWWLAALFALLFLGIYLPVMRVEEKALAELFGDEFERYARRVPLFFPRFSPHRDERERATKFDSSLYLRYREYRAALGALAGWLILLLKAMSAK
ncbi:MAG: isoprenylcysteine carboxylmethyltransferase family protein [Pyrinomonadaceae bacterium]|nr:isoprenylcysteine carboxylmethyltransferase family protein [Pyrinomonadaceae bacterium]